MCGNPDTRQPPANRPVLVSGLSGHNVVDITVGAEHTLALTSKHLVFAWGANTDGQVQWLAGLESPYCCYVVHCNMSAF